MTIAHDNRVSAATNTDGTNDTRWPNGDKPVSGTGLTVDAAAYAAFGSFLSLPINVEARFDVRAILGGSEAATATLSLVTISGNDASAGGWALDGDDLVFSGSSANSGGVLEVIATPLHGSPVTFPQSAWSSANPAADSMAPTAPTGFSVISAQGALQAIWDTAGDGYDGSTAGGGVDHYLLYKDSVSTANKLSPPSPIASPSSAAMPRLTATSIGGASPAPTFSQSQLQWTIVAAGAGFHAVSSDECAFLGAQMSGDQAMSLTVDPYTSTIPYSPVGIMVRESLAPDAPFIAWYWQPFAELGLQGKSRDNAGANSANFLAVSKIAAPVKLLVIRQGSLWTLFYSTTGGKWNVGGTKTLAMAQNCQWGAVVSSQVSGTTITAVIESINLTANGQVSATVQTDTALTLGVTAVDKAGNESAPSIFALGTPLAVTGTISHVPGIRLRLGGYGEMATLASIQSSVNNVMQYDVNHRIKGICISPTLAQLEGPTLGQYDGFGAENGFTKIGALISWLKNQWGLDLTIEINGGGNGWSVNSGGMNSPNFLSAFAPAYMNSPTYDGGETHYANGASLDRPYLIIWNQNVADRVVACVAAYYAEFGADSPTGGIYRWDPYQEISINANAKDYSPAALLTVWPSFMAGLRAAAPGASIFVKPTYINPNDGSSYPTILTYAFNNHISMGCEDCADNRFDWGMKAYLGQWASTPVNHATANNGNPDWDYHVNIDPAELWYNKDNTRAIPPATYGSGRLYDGSPTYPGIWTTLNLVRASHADIYASAFGGPPINRVGYSGPPANPSPGPGAGSTASRPNLIDVLTGNTNYPGILANGCAMAWTERPLGYP